MNIVVLYPILLVWIGISTPFFTSVLFLLVQTKDSEIYHYVCTLITLFNLEKAVLIREVSSRGVYSMSTHPDS